MKKPGAIIKPQLLNMQTNNANFKLWKCYTNCWETDQQKTISRNIKIYIPSLMMSDEYNTKLLRI